MKECAAHKQYGSGLEWQYIAQQHTVIMLCISGWTNLLFPINLQELERHAWKSYINRMIQLKL